MEPSGAILEFADVARRYARGASQVPALEGLSLRVRAGEFLAVVGPSGCGKSTLLNLAAAVDFADAGRVLVCGLDPARARERELVHLRRRAIGVVFQAFHLMPHLSAAENVALPLALDGRADPARVDELLARIGLSSRGADLPSELSGGEQQRVALARALVHRPRLVLADEPTGNLDSRNGERVLELLEELRAEHGATLVLATHDRGIAARADRVLALRDGRLVGPEAP